MKVLKKFICKTQCVRGKDAMYQQGQWVPTGEDIEISDKDAKLYPGCLESAKTAKKEK